MFDAERFSRTVAPASAASVAGASYGFVLLWALLFSVAATFVLQEMSARLGLVTRQGLAEALRRSYADNWRGTAAILLVVAAVGFGNAAYEAGNIAGAALDVYETEPAMEHPLFGHPRVVATPHLGASSKENMLRIGDVVVRILEDFAQQTA